MIVTNTPGVLTDATADIALALILISTRRLGEGERLVRSGEGVVVEHVLPARLGAPGQDARDRRPRPDRPGDGAPGARARHGDRLQRPPARRCRGRGRARGARYLSFDELLATADVVSLHCPLTPETRHLIDAAALGRMKPTAFLINTTRGPVVDEALSSRRFGAGTIAGAGLDVYEHEPIVHPGLLELENVVLLPHLGSATVETRTAMAVLAANNVLAVLRGEPPLTQVRA